MTRYLAVLLFAFSAVALGSSGNISKVNGSITVEAGQQAGDVSTVNGSIRLGQRVQARAVETVNGGITVEEDATVSDDLGTVNGKVALRRGTRVDGRLETVNGTITLESAQVRGGLETVNGDIHVGSGSQIEGGIVVSKPHGWNWPKSQRLPRVTIESGAVVEGALRFEREVELQVADGAVVGPVEGVTPRRIP